MQFVYRTILLIGRKLGGRVLPRNSDRRNNSHMPQPGVNESHGHKKPSSSSASSPQRKSRWESDSTKKPGALKHVQAPSNPLKPAPTPHSTPGPIPSPRALFPFPNPTALGLSPLPTYDFHMLERQTIVLADSSVRSYFTHPLDSHNFTPPRPHIDPTERFLPMGRGLELGGFDKWFPLPTSPRGFSRWDYWNSLGLDGRGAVEESMKMKYSKEDEFVQHGHPNRLPFGPASDRGESWARNSGPFDRGDEYRAFKYMKVGGSDNVGLKHLEVDQNELKAVFLQLAKLVNENASQKKNYSEEGKHGWLQCIACGKCA